MEGEFLPDDETLAARATSRRGLTRPELAVLLAYAKMSLDQDLLASDLPDLPELAADLRDYFPPALRERFAAQIAAHPLRREITATVVTNDFGVLVALAPKSNIHIVMLGGELRRKNMAFYGGLSVEALDALHVDWLFLGVDGFDLERGITTHHEPEARLNRKMAEAARSIVAITDSSKFGKICLHSIISISELDTLITDTGVPEEIQQASESFGFELLLA